MKRHFFKTSLSAFIFTLAIVASFAFSPTLNDTENDPVKGYIQTLDPMSCEKVIHDCIIGGVDCTITVIGGEAPVFYTKTGTLCTEQLSRPPY
ncbi:MAG TPA: DUF6520 family protein [Mariniflexile sp.]